MKQQHLRTEDISQVRGDARRFSGVFGEVVARDHPGGWPHVLPTSHHQDRPMRVMDDVLGVAAQQHASQANVSAAPHYQQVGCGLLAQPDSLLEGTSFSKVRPGNSSAFLLDPFHLFVEGLTPLSPKLPLDESVRVGCVHIVPDVHKMNLRAPPSGDIDRRPGRLGRVFGAVGGQHQRGREAVHLYTHRASPARRRPRPPSPRTARAWCSGGPCTLPCPSTQVYTLPCTRRTELMPRADWWPKALGSP